MPMRYAEVSQKELKFLDLTSLTVEEFQLLFPVFKKEFRERMKNFRLDGKPRTGREYQTHSNCPLSTPEDRLLFMINTLSFPVKCMCHTPIAISWKFQNNLFNPIAQCRFFLLIL
jgi:hypothetical protein